MLTRLCRELLDGAPHVVVVATSRRPLNVSGELQHAVPPLELPEDTSMEEAQRSGAVQLFVHHARAVKATFTLNADNVTDVVAVCTRLDGLPLAIELAAARTKLLSPHALLARLDTALDITASGSRRPSRQKTLRDTIAWSYDLLNPDQQAVFRRLGVFAGGADLDAITTVALDAENGTDPLDMVAGLLDASLITMGDDERGEPRIGMLETIRIYAQDQLRAVAELDAVRRAHAQHYLMIAQQMGGRVSRGGDEVLEARRRLERDLDNLREALTWTLGEVSGQAPSDVTQIGAPSCVRASSSSGGTAATTPKGRTGWSKPSPRPVTGTVGRWALA